MRVECGFPTFGICEYIRGPARKLIHDADTLAPAGNHIEAVRMLGSEAVFVDEIFLNIEGHILIEPDSTNR